VGSTVECVSASLRRCPCHRTKVKRYALWWKRRPVKRKVPDAIDLLMEDDLVKRDLSDVRHGCILAELTRH